MPFPGWTTASATDVVATAVFLFHIGTGCAFFLLSENQTYTMNPGESIELNCEFYTAQFNLFDNPVLWIKTQHTERSRLNIMSNINEPFMDTNRFLVEFEPTPPRYRLMLRIQDLSSVDVGRYTCEIRGPQTSVLGTITHQVFVRAPVDAIFMTEDNCTETCEQQTTSIAEEYEAEEYGIGMTSHDGQLTPSAPVLSFTENKPAFLQCKVTGGSPTPDVRIFIEDFDISYRFTVHNTTRLSGQKGLRTIHSATYLRTNYLVLGAEDDGKRLSCTASVQGLPDNGTYTTIQVQYAPVITCQNTQTYEGKRFVNVTCQIQSKPRVDTVYWVIDKNGTSIREDSPEGEFWTIVRDDSDNLVLATLYVTKVRDEHFQSYSLVAGNVVGIATQTVRLERHHQRYKKPRGRYRSPDSSRSQSHDSLRDPANGAMATTLAKSRPYLVCNTLLHLGLLLLVSQVSSAKFI